MANPLIQEAMDSILEDNEERSTELVNEFFVEQYAAFVADLQKSKE